VARLPLFGTLMRASGHFIVPYSSEQYDSFELNTALMAQTQEVVTEHLQINGNLMFFPEGRVNATPDSIGSLRLGGFKLALEYDAAIWTVVFYGITIPGPRQRQSGGGYPVNGHYSVFQIAPNGCRALLPALRNANTIDQTDAMLLSLHVQQNL